MSYSGKVQAGGPSDVRELPEAVIRKASVSEQDNNAYLITDRATGAQLLIDAAADAPRLVEFVAEGGPELAGIVTTHQHWDHHRALAEMISMTNATTYAGRLDAPELPVAVDELLEQGDTITLGELSLDVVHLRGHTPGSVAIVLHGSDGSVHAFTGDSLFPGGVGNTFGSAENFRTLVADVEERIFAAYPDETWVYPGHGNDTTLGAERPSLPEWRLRGW
jgi:glyoxylase-like metal-dependent hydrolase (beta-lactamase superfamily II)